MHPSEIILLIALIGVLPTYLYISSAKTERALIADPSLKIKTYIETIVMQWIPTLAILILLYHGLLSVTDMKFGFTVSLLPLGISAVVILIIGYFILSVLSVKKNKAEQEKMYKNWDLIRWFLPTTKSETAWFIFGLSVTAGICEEIIFRGYLLNFMANYMPIYVAALLSSLAFGLCHAYQGSIHILRTAIVGLIMAGVYIMADSLIVTIILHAGMDIYGGALWYVVSKNQSSQKSSETADNTHFR
ncbi:type II CAAX endopeptidase family protein [Paremcibacter congregatus]|uniref:CPBP family intramembrane glutamic endopeptidase n=1 Tax=Paremcibacter congregatus TaxID=2043170 RepID=UPI0030EEC79D|tara:strand:- start:6906 stop:7643 length:738 start_codon:yes stop_codon:yes gene_type:complete